MEDNTKSNAKKWEKVYSLKDSLTRPIESVNYEKRHECLVCNKLYASKASLNFHKRIHSSVEGYRCDKCDYSTKYKSKLDRHAATHGIRKPYICTICNKSILQLRSYKLHLQIHNNEAELHKCQVCEYSTYYKSILNRHVAAKHTLTTPRVKCGLVVDKRYYKLHLKRHEGIPKNHQCQTCKKHFGSVSNLRRHEDTHKSIKNWRCNQCNKSYTHKSTLRIHIENVHEQKRHECNVCHKLFTMKRALTVHMEIHNSSKIYRCDKCEYSTTTKACLI